MTRMEPYNQLWSAYIEDFDSVTSDGLDFIN
jgi:hypothetical protein